MTEVLTRIAELLDECECDDCNGIHHQIQMIIDEQNRRNELSICDFITRAVEDKQ